MLLKDFMRAERLTDAALAELIGGISAFGVRKLRFRSRGPSIRVAARIEEISGGRVGSSDMQPIRKEPTTLAPSTQIPAVA